MVVIGRPGQMRAEVGEAHRRIGGGGVSARLPRMAEETRYITCVLCEASCGLEVKVDGPTVVSIRGHKQDPLSRGHICPKAIALQDIHTDPDRLRTPVRRVGAPGTDATWEPIGWDEAFDLMAVKWKAAIKQSLAENQGKPPEEITSRVGMFGSGQWTVYEGYAASKLYKAGFRCGRLVVLDPRRTETAKVADAHHFIRPGTDAYVLLAILNVLTSEGLTKPAEYVRGLAEVAAAVAPFTPERAETMSGMPAADIIALARQIAGAESAAVHGRMGVSTQEHGAICQWAV